MNTKDVLVIVDELKKTVSNFDNTLYKLASLKDDGEVRELRELMSQVRLKIRNLEEFVI
ncbi:hypothetical protein FDI40_gp159 [Agrobacterium phage Atu_ph07]|uniref:Uncharacterized protein n=1 Tax=Agrobacterium phage Atu_ph07 TaxID=2024264 RepID=A0A2L0UZI6_9CAUD|nr:hypothetical protein FDI40_gp159 [Agrobacterium phage Atu_ph07]AUZ94941.1 hypothetical protein [Agrobacterium phage Atu_ph07]